MLACHAGGRGFESRLVIPHHAAETPRQDLRLDRHRDPGAADDSVPVRDRQQLPWWRWRSERGQGFRTSALVAFGAVVVAGAHAVAAPRDQRAGFPHPFRAGTHARAPAAGRELRPARVRKHRKQAGRARPADRRAGRAPGG
ncbi:hypothetical protein G6F31_017791 [Rhizopus arrhizus]|nr:hypothetical protein G6F31_017791 [Rhizopus arrhizus]